MNNIYNLEKIDLFNPINRGSSLTGRVTKEIEDMLMDNGLIPGQKLPPERELARQFNVSRTVIREAVKALGAKGLLEVKTGSGTIVRRPDLNVTAQSLKMFLMSDRLDIDFKKIIEIRRLIEVEIAGLSAKRRSSRDIEKLEQILENSKKNRNNREQFAILDVEFHAALASATKNELFMLILNALSEVMIKLRFMAYDVEDMTVRSLRLHTEIFEKVKEGDVKGARKAMISHLDESEMTMLEIIEKNGNIGFISSST